MKKTNLRRRFFLSLLLLGCFIGGVYLSVYFRSKSEENGANPEVINAQSSRKFSTASTAPTGLHDPRRIAALTKSMQKARDIGLSLNAPMEFYGRVVDQFGKPVPGVSAKLRYVYYNAVVLATYEPHNAEEKRVTDGNGEFSFSGKEGVTLTVTLEPQTGLRFGDNGYWSHNFQSAKKSGVTMQPTTKEHPFIFPAYRLGQPAKVKDGFIEAYLIPDKRAYQIHLAKGKITEDGVGDLSVSVWQAGVYGKSGTSWGISIKGGSDLQFQSTEDSILYWAPSEGYQASWGFSWVDGEKGYSRGRNFKFWFKEAGSYGWLRIECTAHFKDEFQLLVFSSLNQKPGDQNLQPVLADWPPKDAAAGK